MSKYRLYLVGIIILAIIAVVVVKTMPLRKGLDIDGGVRVLFQVDEESSDWPTDPQQQVEKLRSIRETINRRVKSSAELAESLVVPQSGNRVRVEIPGVRDQKKAVEYIKSTASLEFYHLNNVQTPNNPLATWKMTKGGDMDEGYIFTGENGEVIDSQKDPEAVLEKIVDIKNNKPIVTGKDLLPNAKANISPNEGNIIEIEFNTDGTKAFGDFTKRNIEEILAVFFDGKLMTAPSIKDAIPGGKAQISGFKSLEEAKRAASMLQAGALPVPLHIVSSDLVEPTLGKDTVNRVVKAGVIGLLTIIIFMLFYYRLPGMLADVALILYSLFLVAVFALIKYPISLSGIAAIIISIGMAVDANVLIFERLKEELKAGKTLRAAVDAGFNRAFTAILDSNVCTAITCAILMWYGGPSVYTFALTLLIGVALSMFTAITVTRTLIHLLVGWEKAQNPSLYGLTSGWMDRPHPDWNIVGKRNIYFALSAVLIVPGLIFLGMYGLRPGIEFKSGTEVKIIFNDVVERAKLKATIDTMASHNEVQMASGGQMAFIKLDWVRGKGEEGSTEYDRKTDDLKQVLTTQFSVLTDPETNMPSISTSSVEPTVSKELTRNAIYCVLFASIGIILYLTIRFAIGGLTSGLKFGVCAVIALVHDAAFILGMFAVLGKFLHWEVDSVFVTAILTIIGFSVHDTIVIYDRIRENLKHRMRGEAFSDVCNKSIMQTLSRSINTSITTSLPLVFLILLGGPMLRQFYVAMLAGIIIGTYSSIFNATPLIIVWEGFANRGKSPARKVGDKALADKPLVEKPLVETATADTETKLEESKPAPARPRASSGRAKKKSPGRKRRF